MFPGQTSDSDPVGAGCSARMRCRDNLLNDQCRLGTLRREERSTSRNRQTVPGHRRSGLWPLRPKQFPLRTESAPPGKREKRIRWLLVALGFSPLTCKEQKPSLYVNSTASFQRTSCFLERKLPMRRNPERNLAKAEVVGAVSDTVTDGSLSMNTIDF